MLILSRRKDEVIRIGDDITIMVTQIDARQGRVKLGIAAPRGTVVLRREELEAIQRENAKGKEGGTP